MLKSIKSIFLILLCFGSLSCQAQKEMSSLVKVGAESLIDAYLPNLEGKKVALAMNPTARVNKVHMLDTLLALDVDIIALFAAEHGFRGEASDGEIIKDGIDQQSGLPVYSLYGKNKKPTLEMLKGVDIILFDMQDVGARFYTFYITLAGIIEEASKAGIEVWVLDRPNPLGGEYVQGWILEENYYSNVGRFPIPIAHGMTLGELMKMAIGEGWIDADPNNLKVIEMEGWSRYMKWPDIGMDWFAPSPNLPAFENTFVYAGMALLEGTSISEGRGTDNPFLKVGSPHASLDTVKLNQLMDQHSFTYSIEKVTPITIPGKAYKPKFEDQSFFALSIDTVDYNKTDPIQMGLDILLYYQIQDSTFGTRSYLNNLAGVDLIGMIEKGYVDFVDEDEIEAFKKLRSRYLIYH